MEIKLPYGNFYQTLDLNNNTVTILKPNEILHVNPVLDLDDFIKYLKAVDNLLVLVNDHSRITPTKKIFDYIFDALKTVKRLKFIIATGTHPLSDIKKVKKIFGKYYEKIADDILIHDGLHGSYKYFGTTSFGTKVFFNKIITEFDNILTIGGVEPHYFAGFSGGRKSLFPGIASYQSIESNHKLALEKESEIMNTGTNPVSLDMEEAVSLVGKNIYSIQVVNDEKGRILFISQGDIRKSFYKAVEFAKEYFTVNIKDKQDIVISVVEAPFDRNFYQAHKGLENTKNILKEKGMMILVAKCSEGIGNDNFYKLLKKTSNMDNVFSYIKRNYKLGYHKTAKILQFLQNHKLILVTDMPPSYFSGINIEVYSDVQDAINSLPIDNRKIAIVFNAAVCVPFVK